MPKKRLTYVPHYEPEVLILFGMLLRHLDEDFVIEEYNDRFPDCTAIKDGKKIGIEFEVYSSTFITGHRHHESPDLPECDMIVCWKSDMGDVESFTYEKNGETREKQIEILDLSKVIEDKGLDLVGDKTRPGADIVDRPEFFNRLRKKAGEEKYGWFKTLIEFCESRRDVFTVASGTSKPGSRHFRIMKWRRKRIGKPTPIQFYADGYFALDYRDMPNAVEEGLRRGMKQPEGSYHVFRLEDEETFNRVKATLEWLAENYDKSLPP